MTDMVLELLPCPALAARITALGCAGNKVRYQRAVKAGPGNTEAMIDRGRLACCGVCPGLPGAEGALDRMPARPLRARARASKRSQMNLEARARETEAREKPAPRTHCKEGHDLRVQQRDPKRPWRCRVCVQAWRRRWYLEQMERDPEAMRARDRAKKRDRRARNQAGASA